MGRPEAADATCNALVKLHAGNDATFYSTKRDPLARRVSTCLAGLRGHSGEVRVDDAGGPLVGLTVLVFCLLVISARDQAFIGTLVHLR